MSKPILYPQTETKFQDNGMGVLSDAVSCTVTEERNGAFELEMQYPVSEIHYKDITLRSLILAKPNPTADPQPFRVYRISKPMQGTVAVFAEHISYDLSGIPVSPFEAGSAAETMARLKSSSAVANSFTFWTDKNTTAVMRVSAPSSLRSLLGGREGSVLDVYGGEYAFDRYTVRLYNQRGENRGVSIRYGKNLTDLEQEENCANVYTGVYPYYIDGEGALTQLPEKIVNAPGTYPFTRILPLDQSQYFDEPPTPSQMRTAAQSYIRDNKIGTPKVSLSVSFVQLEQTEEYKHLAGLEQVSLCDEVNVEFPAMGVSTTAKCVKTIYDVLLDRYISVELGDARTNIADTIANQQKEIENAVEKSTTSSFFKQAVANLTASILGAKGGSVRLLDTDEDGEPDTLYIADHPDPDKAKKVWRFNYEGWGASENGYNGPFELGATFADGIIANFITAGTLNADLIKAGTIKSTNERMTINLDQGTFNTWGISQLTGQEIRFEFNNGTIKYYQGNKKKGEWYNDNNASILGTEEIDAYGYNLLMSGDIDDRTEENLRTVIYHDIRGRAAAAAEAFYLWFDAKTNHVFAYTSGKDRVIETDILWVDGREYTPTDITVDGESITVLAQR